MDPINPPSIVRPSPELEQIAFEVKADIETGDRLTKQGIERYRSAGLALLKAKELCQHGTWLDWLTKVGISSQRASECMRIASGIQDGIIVPHELPPGGSLKETLEVAPSQRDASKDRMCRDCRVQFGSPQSGCKTCASYREDSVTIRKCCKTLSSNPHSDDCPEENPQEYEPKPGTEMFSLRTFHDLLGKATAEVNKLAREIGLTKTNPQGVTSVVATPTHRGLERMLSEALKLLEGAGQAAEQWREECKRRETERWDK